MDLVQISEQIFRYMEPASITFLLIRLATERLLGFYKAFTAYLVIWLCQDAVPLLFGLSLSGDRYARFYFVSEPLAWLFSCLVLLELFDLTFASFRGIRSAGKLLLTTAILLAALVGIGTAIPGLRSVHGMNGLLLLYSILERSVMLISLILLGALQYLTVHYRLELPKNTAIYSFTYAIYFTARAIDALIFSELGPRSSMIVNTFAMAVDVLCLVFWGLTLTRAGIEIRVVPGPRLSTGERERLRGQLVAVNDMVGRFRKRI